MSRFTRVTSGLEAASHLISLENMATPGDWSPDGSVVLLDGAGPVTGSDIFLYSIEDGNIEPYLQTDHNEELARFSPDGRWVAYHSDESGRR